MKLDRLVARHQGIGRKEARKRIASRRVSVDGHTVTEPLREVDRFADVRLDGAPVRNVRPLLRIMMNKPAGILSATRDSGHRTVLDLIDHPDRDTLHLAGRLDLASTGLLLLTNDGRWSKALMAPDRKVPKVYVVETDTCIPHSAVEAFARGFHFHTEDIVTRPARLDRIGEKQARVTIHEGRYHQIKRMFHRVGNRVLRLHRESIGSLTLPPALAPGEWRELDEEEAAAVLRCETATAS